ncbi:hypothetical protein [Streptomyces cyaneochromogenes]|uniref:hypothetical protein n=1 Tax=Streptomyces cyaneochromogenes TaxID=2496836 RepID=UPI00158AE709|nr:hypothetical protein [Streptomyces cyaneochromogenes]
MPPRPEAQHKLVLHPPARDVPGPMGQGDDDLFNDFDVLIKAGTALHVGRTGP